MFWDLNRIGVEVAWGKPQRGVAKSYTTSNDTVGVLNWLNLASRRQMHKCNRDPTFTTSRIFVHGF